MNCPQCLQPVGNDAYAIGQWMSIMDERGVAQQIVRPVLIDCDHCGRFDVTEDIHHRTLDIVGPLTGDASLERFAREIPSVRREVRIPA